MPPHSSHLLQPLDVSCFGPLKKAYGREIKKRMRAGTTHISKEDFFPAFFRAFQRAITVKNIQGGFKGSGILPHNLESVLLKLNVKFKTPTPPGTSSRIPDLWTSRTPINTNEATLQSILLTDRVSRHQGSSPTSIIKGINHLTKGTQIFIHQIALLEAENKTLRETNNILSRRRRVKKQRLRLNGAISIAEGHDQIAQKEADVQIKQETQQRRSHKARAEVRSRRYRTCRDTRHNVRTCQAVISSTIKNSSD
jgi:hypothetical protein